MAKRWATLKNGRYLNRWNQSAPNFSAAGMDDGDDPDLDFDSVEYKADSEQSFNAAAGAADYPGAEADPGAADDATDHGFAPLGQSPVRSLTPAAEPPPPPRRERLDTSDLPENFAEATHKKTI